MLRFNIRVKITAVTVRGFHVLEFGGWYVGVSVAATRSKVDVQRVRGCVVAKRDYLAAG